MIDEPQLAIIAGPNGAGKSTVAPLLLQDGLHISEFVNADEIARGLSAFDRMEWRSRPDESCSRESTN